MMGKKHWRALIGGIALLVLGVMGGVMIQRSVTGWNTGMAVVNAADRERTALEDTVIDVANSEEWNPAGDDWDLTFTMNETVQHWIEFLTTERRDKMHLWLERSGKYGPMIQAELRKRGMPEDLLYLALIESGFSPTAHSSADAVGIWQFIAGTARRYGLEITRYVDERRDPLAATDAALDYLQDLHDRFGSWYLAAASYNTGENRVGRILRERVGGRRGADELFWEIDEHLPWETRNYVPLTLAAGHIAKNPERYGFKDLEHQNPLNFDVVEVPGMFPLSSAARAADVELEAIRSLNPHLLASVTPPGDEYRLRIPAGRTELFARNLEAMEKDDETRLAVVQHTVRRGETLSEIAYRYGTSVRRLQTANNWLNPRALEIGQRLRIPVAGDTDQPDWLVYRVRRGDTLWGIARRYNVRVGQLKSWNGLGGGSRILPGQRLRVRA